jgi:hypothetical protein
VIPLLDESAIDRRYFFESSMFIELGLIRAVIRDVYIPARYGAERSSLSERKALFHFPPRLLRGWLRRVGIQYFLRDFGLASIYLVAGIGLLLFGLVFGGYYWIRNSQLDISTPTGTVMIAAMSVLLGIQFLLQSIFLDVQNLPTDSVAAQANENDVFANSKAISECGNEPEYTPKQKQPTPFYTIEPLLNDHTGTNSLPQQPSLTRPWLSQVSMLLRLIVLGALIGLIIVNFKVLFPWQRSEVSFMLQNPRLNASQKLEVSTARDPLYALGDLIAHTTPQTSTILIPIPGDVEFGAGWPGLANNALMRGFLYPRNITTISNAEWETKWRGTTQPDVYILVFSYQGLGGQVHTWPTQRPLEQDITYVNQSKWGFAPVSH